MKYVKSEVPTMDDFMRPVLEYANQRSLAFGLHETVYAMADHFNLSTEARAELTEGGNIDKVYYRTNCAILHLIHANFLRQTGRGIYEITDIGREEAKSSNAINVSYLGQKIETKREQELENSIDESIRLFGEKGYIPKVFINKRHYGTVKAIKWVLASEKIQSGFKRIQKIDLLDWSVEAIALKFPEKFTSKELEIAKKRLKQANKDREITCRVSDSLGETTSENKEKQEYQTDNQEEKRIDNNLLNCKFWQEATVDDLTNSIVGGANIKARDSDYAAPLHKAVRYNRKPEVIALLLDQGIDINPRDKNSNTPLHWAAADNKPEVVALLLNKGADINARNKSGNTPLNDAKRNKQLKGSTVYTRLQGKHSKSIQNSTPELSSSYRKEAIRKDKLGDIHNSLRYKNNSIKDENNHKSLDASLHSAIVTGQSLAEINSLLNRGANTETRDMHGRMPLHVAVLFGCSRERELRSCDIIKLLLKNGANIEARDIHGKTPLHLALTHGLKYVERLSGPLGEIVKLLLISGANAEARGEHGDTPLHYVIEHNILNAPKIVDLLLKRGANVNVHNEFGDTPLHLVASKLGEASINMMELLLNNGGIINTHNEYGTTPLHVVACSGGETALKMMNLLLDKGANINALDRSGNTPLHLVASYARRTELNMIELLLSHGADINARNKYGDTPLHLTITGYENLMYISRTIQMVKLLLDKGADATIRNKDRKTPFHYIKGEKNFKKKDVYHRLRIASGEELGCLVILGIFIIIASMAYWIG